MTTLERSLDEPSRLTVDRRLSRPPTSLDRPAASRMLMLSIMITLQDADGTWRELQRLDTVPGDDHADRYAGVAPLLARVRQLPHVLSHFAHLLLAKRAEIPGLRKVLIFGTTTWKWLILRRQQKLRLRSGKKALTGRAVAFGMHHQSRS